MKRKSFVVAMMLCMFAIFMSACGGPTTNITVSTSSNVYNFYAQQVESVCDEMLSAVASANLTQEQTNRVNVITNNVDILSREEYMVLAGIECYNMISDNGKYSYVQTPYGRLIVEFSNGVYTCRYLDDNGDTLYTYALTINRNSQTGRYTIQYEKTIPNQTKNCVATVNFNSETSNLVLNISSILENGQNIQIEKEYYALSGGRSAIQIDISLNSQDFYGARYFKEMTGYSMKLASKQSFSGRISLSNLTSSSFCASDSTDICGYIINNNSLQSFGQLSEW